MPISDLPTANESERPAVSQAVIKRLPRYFRYLRELLRQGKMRISSGELSALMNVTASQIRQDLNCFGGFGQQGYGYNVNYLYAKICEILGVGAGLTAIVIGVGDLGRALVRSSMFEKRGVDIIGLFDIAPNIVNTQFGSLTVAHMDTLADFCKQNQVDFAVLTLPKNAVVEVSEQLMDLGVRGLWNFTGAELPFRDDSMIVENVHLGDSLMTLNYKLCADREVHMPEQD
ncbi:MAG: redox-sensing transcriptional repressor Rex [Ruminococcaceae bacterium]|nr:redox-sensing transcriptional repressor Rex [Oscillospiraceae bacterium]